jgi:hypothetical protein
VKRTSFSRERFFNNNRGVLFIFIVNKQILQNVKNVFIISAIPTEIYNLSDTAQDLRKMRIHDETQIMLQKHYYHFCDYSLMINLCMVLMKVNVVFVSWRL